MEVFHDVDELATKIRYYLAYPSQRDSIANAGFERTCQHHLYDHRLSEVLEFALRQRERLTSGREVQKQAGINWEAFGRAVKRHHYDRRLALVKTLLTASCSHVWGPARGERAARRILFEMSWRVAGSHTYSAAGWPGRLFYEVS